jgi:hypothetical protein
MNNLWHNLYEGTLNDAPGRCESWVDQVRYDGRSQWTLRCIGADFNGLNDNYELRERMGTRTLIRWVLERDSELYDQEIFGDFSKSLLTIADEVGADYCVSLLTKNKYYLTPDQETGELPPPKILKITGITTIKQRSGPRSNGYKSVYSILVDGKESYPFPYPYLSLAGDELVYGYSESVPVNLSSRLLKQKEAVDSATE